MKLKLFLISIFHLFLVNGTIFLSGGEKSLPDSLVTIENVYVYCLSEPEKAQQIIDRLRQLKADRLAFDYEMDWAQGDLYFNTGRYRLASYYFEKVEQYEKVKTNRQFMMGLLSTMVESYRMNNNLEKAMETAIRLLEITEADDIKEETGRAYHYMGDVFFARGDKQQAAKYFDMAEKQLIESKHIPYLYHYYMTVANLFAKDGQYKQALVEVEKAEKILQKVATDPLMMPEGYNEYEQGRFRAFAADILARNGKTKEAETCYKEFMEGNLSELIENKILIVPYLLTIRKYEEAIEIAQERENSLRQNTDTIGDDMLAVKSYMATAYKGLELKDNTIDNLKQQLAITDSLKARQLKTTTQELATIYETEKKDAALKEKQAEAELHKLILVILVIIILLTLIILVLIVRNQKRTKRNNRLMARQIKEMQQYRQQKDVKEAEKSVKNQETLFEQLEILMRKEYIYRDPACNRETIMEKLSVDRYSLAKLLHDNEIESLPDYINGFRLVEATVLLEKEDTFSIEQIAQQVGFGSVRTMQRLFKEKYNMSPAKYRIVIREK